MGPKMLDAMMKFTETIARPELVTIACQWCSTNIGGRGWDETDARKNLETKLKESGWEMVAEDSGERFPCCKFCLSRVVGTPGTKRARARGAR